MVALFGLFSVLGAVTLAHQHDWWIVGYTALTALVAYCFRRLWWGDDRDRKTGVVVGFMVSAIIYFCSPEDPVQNWSASEFVDLAEGCYFFLAACYLIYARKNPFFAGPQAI